MALPLPSETVKRTCTHPGELKDDLETSRYEATKKMLEENAELFELHEFQHEVGKDDPEAARSRPCLDDTLMGL